MNKQPGLAIVVRNSCGKKLFLVSIPTIGAKSERIARGNQSKSLSHERSAEEVYFHRTVVRRRMHPVFRFPFSLPSHHRLKVVSDILSNSKANLIRIQGVRCNSAARIFTLYNVLRKYYEHNFKQSYKVNS